MPVRPCPYNLRNRPADFAEVHKAQICLEYSRKGLSEGSFPFVLTRLSHTTLPVWPCPYGSPVRPCPYVPARTSNAALPLRPLLVRPCPCGPARTALHMALPARPCSYGSPVIPCLRLSVRPCPCNPGRTALPVQPWLYDPGCAALAVQPCSHGPGRGALAVWPWLHSPARAALHDVRHWP